MCTSWFGWPPKDKPTFWVTTGTLIVTTAAFIAVCVYAVFTKQQVFQSKRANDIADKAFFTINRPYIMWRNDNPVRVVPPGATQPMGWQIFSLFENFGKTPATNAVIQFCDLIIRTNSIQPVFTCTMSEVTPRDAGIIGPGQQQLMTGPTINDPEFFNDTFAGKKFLYVFGYFTYHDDLLGKETHTTRFCHQIAQRTPPSEPIGYITYGCHDPLWNCVDNGCAPLPSR